MDKIVMGHILYGIRNAVIGFAVGVAIYFGASLIWWEFGNYESVVPTVIVPIEVTNVNNEVKSNGTVQLKIFINKPREISPTNVNIRFFCDNGQFYDAKGVNAGVRLPIGIYQRNVEFYAPNGLPVGETCTFAFTQDYEVNPIKTITKVWTSQRFTIIQGE